MPFNNHAYYIGERCLLTGYRSRRKMDRLLTVVLSIFLSSLTQPYPQVHAGEETATPPKVCLQNVTFLHFIPCWRENHKPALDRLDSCDLLARAAVELAIERVNENQNEIFGSSQRHVGIVPLFPDTNDTINVSSILYSVKTGLSYCVQRNDCCQYIGKINQPSFGARNPR